MPTRQAVVWQLSATSKSVNVLHITEAPPRQSLENFTGGLPVNELFYILTKPLISQQQ